MGRACSAYGGEEIFIQGFGGENLTDGNHLKDPGVDGMLILKLIFENWAELDRSGSGLGQMNFCCECLNIWGP
jgi:hypothetical protein